jgi:hypothetical protein
MSRPKRIPTSKRKERLTVTVDPALIEVGARAVRAGRADSLSSWVNLALAERVAKEQRLAAMADAVVAYEAKFGEISLEELAQQVRLDRASAIVVRGGAHGGRRKRRRAAA